MAEIRTPGNKVWINDQGQSRDEILEELPVIEEQKPEAAPQKSSSPKELKVSSKSGKKGLKPLSPVFDDQDELDEEEDKMDMESTLAEDREM
jgi:hypothetical protein